MTVEPPDRIVDMFLGITFDGTWPDAESAEIWEHFVVDGPSPRSRSHPSTRLDPSW